MSSREIVRVFMGGASPARSWPATIRSRQPGLGRPGLIAVAPLPILYLILSVPALNPRLVLPSQHLWLAIAISAIALALAGLLAVATVQIGLYRVLLLALGFMTMGILFGVHAISGSILGAYLSLFLPAVLILASYLPATAQFEFRVPFWPGSWLVVVVIATLLSFSALTLAGSDALAALESDSGPLVHLLAAATSVLLAVSAASQARSYLTSRQPDQATLALAFAFLAEAQLVMVAAQPWTLAWWAYQLLILGALAAALWDLVAGCGQGRSLRAIVEGILELEVNVGTELNQVDTIARLAAAIAAKDGETQGHNCRVARLAVEIGHEMGLCTGQLRVLARSGLLHDVGKISIPDAILFKPGPLTYAEEMVMKQHPKLGVDIINAYGCEPRPRQLAMDRLSHASPLQREVDAVLHHHERVDGSGYPDGLAGDAIPLEARIVAVADTYDVLTSDRAYRRGRSQAEAIAIMAGLSGTHLDPKVVKALLRVLQSRAKVVALNP